MSGKFKEELFWEINKTKMAFSGVLTLYVSERERENGRRGLRFEYLAAVTTWVKPLSELFRKDSRCMLLSTLERQPPSNIQFKEAFPPHKSPTQPLLLVPVFGEEYKYSYVLFVQLPFKIGILSSPKRQDRKGQISTLWQT